MTAVAASPWLRCWTPRPQARARLLAFPWAGASAAVLAPLCRRLPEHVEGWVVEYPGHGARLAEPPWTSVAALADGAGRAARALLAPQEPPCTVLGYSLGALVAYEWLRAEPHRPARFIGVARVAPHLTPDRPRLSGLPDDGLIDAIERHFGPLDARVKADPELLGVLLPALRADLAAVDGYTWSPGPVLDCPALFVGGAADPEVTPQALEPWREHAPRGAQFRILSDVGHFFASDPRFEALLHEALR